MKSLTDMILAVPLCVQVRLTDEVNAVVVQLGNEYFDVDDRDVKQATKYRKKFKGVLRDILITLHMVTVDAARALGQSIGELCAADSVPSVLLVQYPFSQLLVL